MSREKVIRGFREKFSGDPRWITQSPGRVNIIGEHTDYNDGFVLPMAINYSTWVALQPRQDRHVHITALDMGEELEFDLDQFEKGDMYLLCSDGLTDLVPDDQIAEIMKKKEDVDSVAVQLIDAANDAGGKDNVSVVVCRV